MAANMASSVHTLPPGEIQIIIKGTSDLLRTRGDSAVPMIAPIRNNSNGSDKGEFCQTKRHQRTEPGAPDEVKQSSFQLPAEVKLPRH